MGYGETPGDIVGQRPAHPFIDEQQRAPESPRVIALAGLLGDSHRPGCRSIYVMRDLKRCVEFKLEDVTAEREIPPDEPPFIGLTATEIQLTPGAELHYVSSGAMASAEDWDLATRLGAVSFGPDDLPTFATESGCAITGMKRCKCPDVFWIADPEW